MGDDEGAIPIHGQLDERLKVPVQVEHGGRLLRVVRDVPRMDLQLAAWKRDLYRTYRELTLSNGTQLVVFHDLVKGGWFQVNEPLAEPAPDAP